MLATVDQIRKAADRQPLKIGRYTVDSHQLPVLLWITTDLNDTFPEIADGVRVLRDAARGAKVTPTPALERC